MVITSYSKIKLSLIVNSKLNNGLHQIQSLYCWIDLSDKIKITKIKKNKDKIIFKGPFSNLVKNKNNTISILLKKLRVLKLISSNYSISITKNIPVFGGLGGGTSNAAFLLKYLLKNKFKKNLLKKVEPYIGSDLKLFFKKQGFLENLKTVINLKKKQKFHFLLIQPKVKCSTTEIFANVRKLSKKEKFSTSLINSRLKFMNYLSKSRNDLQFIVERKHPIVKKLLSDINNAEGCYLSRMTGSGSVCYGLFNDKNDAKKAFKKLKKRYPKFWFSLAKTV